MRMCDINDDYARVEGRRYADADEWRDAHREFFQGESVTEFLGATAVINDDTLVVTERFRLVSSAATGPMSDFESTAPSVLWGARLYGNPCRECDFNWVISTTDAISLVQDIPELYAARLNSASGTETLADLTWSVSAYVSHVSDNLRIWSERFAGARISGESAVAGSDQDLLGVARRYNEINLRAALWSLHWTVEEWADSMRMALVAGTHLHHSDRGVLSVEDIARSNAHDASHHRWDIERIITTNDRTLQRRS